MFIRVGERPDHGFGEPLGLLTDCHRRLKAFLQMLIETTTQAGGGPLTPRQRTDLTAALTYFATAAPRHTADEEESLFPRLCAYGDGRLSQAALVARLERDHAEAERHHAAVDALSWTWLTDGILDRERAAELSAHLSALESIYRDHIAVEDRDLFPLASRFLSYDQLAEIGAEMAARRGLAPPMRP